MDPYLEPHWLDVHTSLVSGARDALNQRLPEDLIASAEERIAVETEAGETHLFGPDVRVFAPPVGSPTVMEMPDGPVATAPYRLLAQVEPIVERFIRIVSAGAERLITVIEFVSPTNKRGEGLYIFRAKRGEMLAYGVNFVEVDLVRAGDWEALLGPFKCEAHLVSPYRVITRLPMDPSGAHLTPIRLQDPLPKIMIPLRKHDPPVFLELQPLLDLAYANGRYARRLNYAKPLDPPLASDDAAWADERVRAAGRR